MNTFKSHYARLSVFNKFLRILQRANIETPIAMLYSSYNILPIHLLFRSQMLLLVCKFIFYKELIPPAYHGYFTTNQQVHSHYTRSFNNLHLDKFSRCIGQRCVRYLASNKWSVLPNSLEVKHSIHSFQKETYAYLMK